MAEISSAKFSPCYMYMYNHLSNMINSQCVCVFILFLLFLGEWTSPTVTGDRPPPIFAFTLTSVGNTTAIMFGGEIGDRYSNDVYVFEFTDTSVVSVLLV